MVVAAKKPAEAVKSSDRSQTRVMMEAPTQIFSLEDYLDFEVRSEFRHEFRNGARIEMAGGLPNHNQVAGNIYATLNFALRRKPYQAFVTDQRLWIPDPQICTYPDVMVMTLPLTLQEGRKDVVMNPILIVEVLSDSTADYDRGDKFAAYQTIPDFQEYLLISQSSQRIEHYVKRSPKKWNFQTYDETDSIVQLSSVGVELAIEDIYDKVEFDLK